MDMEEEKINKGEKEMSFLDHLEELRWHIMRSVLAIVVTGIVVFLFKDLVFDKIILAPKKPGFFTYNFFCRLSDATCFKPPEFKLMPRELGEEFFTHIKVSIWLGIILSFPYIFWEIWKFIKPGLYPNEQKAARGMVFICSSLFLMGVLFGYYVISPFAISFLAGYSVSSEVISSPTLASYVSYMTMFTLPTGLIFELPVVVFFLSKIGLINPQFMKRYRRHAIVIILLIAALITPPDVVTQFLIAVPILILYEISITISARVYKKAAEQEEA
jgi:sec-independent protein translocase protein TatC